MDYRDLPGHYQLALIRQAYDRARDPNYTPRDTIYSTREPAYASRDVRDIYPTYRPEYRPIPLGVSGAREIDSRQRLAERYSAAGRQQQPGVRYHGGGVDFRSMDNLDRVPLTSGMPRPEVYFLERGYPGGLGSRYSSYDLPSTYLSSQQLPRIDRTLDRSMDRNLDRTMDRALDRSMHRPSYIYDEPAFKRSPLPTKKQLPYDYRQPVPLSSREGRLPGRQTDTLPNRGHYTLASQGARDPYGPLGNPRDTLGRDYRDSNTLHRDSNTLHRDSNTFHRDSNALHRDSNALHRDSNALHRDPSATRDPYGLGRDPGRDIYAVPREMPMSARSHRNPYEDPQQLRHPAVTPGVREPMYLSPASSRDVSGSCSRTASREPLRGESPASSGSRASSRPPSYSSIVKTAKEAPSTDTSMQPWNQAPAPGWHIPANTGAVVSFAEETKPFISDRACDWCQRCSQTRPRDSQVLDSRNVQAVYTTDGQVLSGPSFVKKSLEGSNDQEGPESDKALYCCCLGLSVALHVGTLACILGLLWIHYGRRDHYLQLGVYDVLMGLCGAFGILGYIGVLAELIIAESTEYLMNIRSTQEARDEIHNLRHSKPKVLVRVTRLAQRRGQRGSSVVAPVFTEERVLRTACWKDISQEPNWDLARQASFLQVHTRTQLCFLDTDTAAEYERLATELRAKAANIKGEETVLEAVVRMDGLSRRQCVREGATWISKFFCPYVYWLLSLALLTFPARWLLRHRSRPLEFVLIKAVGNNRKQ